ncbi:hypothetical protein JCM21714_3998 [Gracilibacillus boraciitolerans JCM 21714]|uniref:Hydroxymethylpyrimidine ABC transporter n=1 Tax=Gracilibacillus boraciitolerans JCM 21714 TaxID=1298598 RepID=W4VPP1_9BACI|nr:hypothetical protein [Gracilibacillus boraciitolerans]GAE94808.1 hypothetical protein JCM21714_3998 [Gracilibacillus boraciitolerans JCM 21714]
MGIVEGFEMGLDLLWSILTADPLLLLIIILFIACFVIYGVILNIVREYWLKRSGICRSYLGYY